MDVGSNAVPSVLIMNEVSDERTQSPVDIPVSFSNSQHVPKASSIRRLESVITVMTDSSTPICNLTGII